MKSYERPNWLKSGDLYIETLDGSYWRNDYAAGNFGDTAHALTWLQEHLDTYAPDTRLRIAGTAYLVRADGLYVMTNRRGWQKFEGVRE